MLFLEETRIIKDKTFNIDVDNFSYLVKTFLNILDKKKKIRIIVYEVEK